MKSLTSLLLALLLVPACLIAQDAKWLRQVHLLNNEVFSLNVYVASGGQRTVVNLLTQQSPSVPNGPQYPANHYLYGYDTTGNVVWTRSLANMNPLSLINSAPDKFTLVAAGTNKAVVGGDTIASTAPYPDFSNLYFIEMNAAGTVTHSSYLPFSSDMYIIAEDASVDHNGDYILGGYLMAGQPGAVPFSFGSFNTVIPEDRKTMFVMRVHKNGTPGEIFLYDAPRIIQPYSTIQHIACDTKTGDIMFVGQQGDSLAIDGMVFPATSTRWQLYAGRLDSSLTLASIGVTNFADGGVSVNELIYNPRNEAFYMTGNWGNKLEYGQTTALQGLTGHLKNGFISKFQPHTVLPEIVLPFVPENTVSSEYLYIADLAVDDSGAVYACGSVTDSLVKIGNKMYSLNNGNPQGDYESWFMKLSPSLALDTMLFSDDNNSSFFSSLSVGDGAAYCAGNFSTTCIFDGIVATTPDQQPDGLLIKIANMAVTTSVANPQLQGAEITIFPNPANDVLNIHFKEMTGNKVSVDVIDQLGRNVWSSGTILATQDAMSINTSQYAAGTYFVRVVTGQVSTVRQFVIAR